MATSPDSTPDSPEPNTPDETSSAALSGREQEEALRRKAGRPQSVRPTDFEPAAWESSDTKVDRHERDGETGSCLGFVTGGLKSAWSRLNTIEMASVVVFLGVAAAGLFFFRGLVHSLPQLESTEDTSLSSVDFPAKGSLLTINQIDAIWRDPKPGEKVRPGANIVPALTLTFGGGTGYVRILFRDEEGTIRGDVVVEQVSGGKIGGSAEFTAVCSEGLSTSMRLIECQAGREEPWRVEIHESQEFDVDIRDCPQIAAFDMPPTFIEGGDATSE